MFRMLGAAVAAVAIAWAGSAGAATILSISGTGSAFHHDMVLTAPGKYLIELESSAPHELLIDVTFDSRWATFLVDPPPGQDYSFEGDEDYDRSTGNGVVDDTKVSFLLVISKPVRTYTQSGSYHEMLWGIAPGTPMYREDKSYNYRLTASIYDYYDDYPPPFDYRYTITMVPEPDTWAMMIIGFGLAGATVRARRHRRA